MPLRRSSGPVSGQKAPSGNPSVNQGPGDVLGFPEKASVCTFGHQCGQEVYLPTGIHLANSKMDSYLNSLGLFRYHLPVDGSCLFRAVSEVLFGSQNRHGAIRRAVCDFILENRPLVQRNSSLQEPKEEYVRRLLDNNFPGNNNEMHVLAQLYHVDFIVYYRADRGPTNVTQGGYPTKVTLCWSHGKQYDLIYTKEHLEALTVSQAIVYNVLYKNVFELGNQEVDFAVTKMLYDKEHFKNKRHLTFSQWCKSVSEGEERNVTWLPEKDSEQIVLAVRCGVPPFPFRVAKCLDPHVFRNVDFLNWCEEKRDEFRTGHCITPALDTGVKCVARIGVKEHTGFVQSIDTRSKTAQVFLQSIGEIRTLPLSSVESTPVNLRVSQTSHGANRHVNADGDVANKPFRIGVPLIAKSYVKNRRSFSTGDAVTAEQLEILMRSQQNAIAQLQEEVPTVSNAVTENSSGAKLDGIPEVNAKESPEHSTGANGRPQALTGNSDVMTPTEESENINKYCRNKFRKYSLPAGKSSAFGGPPTMMGCYAPIMNACGPVLVSAPAANYSSVDAYGSIANTTDSGVAVVPQLGVPPGQAIIFDPNYGYTDYQGVPDSGPLYTGNSGGSCSYQQATMGVPGEYPVVPMNPVPIVPIAQFNPAVPPPNYGTIPALHSLVTPTPSDWAMEAPTETVEPGFTFRAPPQGMDVSLVELSQLADGYDLPLNRLDIVRYFFNLGLSVYRSRKIAENPALPAEPMTAQTNAYIVPLSTAASYQMVPQQGTVVYQQTPLTSYGGCSGQAYTGYSVVPQVASSYAEAMPRTASTQYTTSIVSTAVPVQASHMQQALN